MVGMQSAPTWLCGYLENWVNCPSEAFHADLGRCLASMRAQGGDERKSRRKSRGGVVKGKICSFRGCNALYP